MKILYTLILLFALTYAKSQDFQSFKVFPNPAIDEISIDFLGKKHDLISIQVYNSIGQKKLEVFPQEKEHIWKFDLSDLPKGYYFIRVMGKENKTSVRQFYIN